MNGRVIFLRVPEQLHEAVRRQADEAGVTLQSCAVELLRAGLTVPVVERPAPGQLGLFGERACDDCGEVHGPILTAEGERWAGGQGG